MSSTWASILDTEAPVCYDGAMENSTVESTRFARAEGMVSLPCSTGTTREVARSASRDSRRDGTILMTTKTPTEERAMSGVSIERNAWTLLVNAIDEYGDLEPDYDYSGRGMYGKECVGVRCDNATAVAVELGIQVGRWLEWCDAGLGYERMAEMGEAPCREDLEVLEEYLPHVRTDNMGLGSIVYWPAISVDGEDD